MRCAGARCTAPRELATRVAGFSVAPVGDGTLIATTGTQHPEITVHRFNHDGAAVGTPTRPAACWDPLGGMCGQPTLAVGGERVYLIGRDGADLLVLTSNDRGEHWEAPRDLGGGAARIDTKAVMEQHRLRKGQK